MIKLSQIFDFLMPRLFFGGGGGGPSSTTVTQSNVPDWLKPQVTGMLDRATQELFQTSVVGTDEEGNPIYEIGAPKPFQPYSTDAAAYVAGQTPIQQSAIDLVFNTPTPWEYTRAADFLSDAGWNAKNMATLGLGYGATGAQSGQLAQEIATRGGAYYGGLGAGYGMAGAQLAPEAAQLGRLGNLYGQVAASELAPQAQMYGQRAADIGQMGLRAEELGRQIGGVAGGYAGQAADIGGLYERMATSPGDVSRYMSPYVGILTQAQQQEAVRQADIARQARKTAAARAGAFGGSRQAIEEAEANRALQTQLQNIQSQNLAAAYQQAQANILNRAQLGLQGLSGAQQGLGTALQGGQLGLSGIGQAMAGQQAGLQGLGQAGQMYGLGMQGAGMGLQGLGQAGQMYGLGMQGAGMGLQGIQQQLAGTSQGMQGAGMGLQGIQQALGGYGLMGQMGGQLGQLGGQRLGANLDIASARFALGEQQRTLNQQIINQAIQNYAAAQETPFQRLSAYSALLRGYATPGQTTTQYQAAPPVASQLAGLGIAGLGLSGLGGGTGRKAGGTIKASDGVDTLALNRALAGA